MKTQLSNQEALEFLDKLTDDIEGHAGHQIFDDCKNMMHFECVKVIRNEKTHTSHTILDVTEVTLKRLFNKVKSSYE